MAFDPYSNPGPTRDNAALAAAMPQWSEERFQIQPKRLPVGFKMTQRPKTVERQMTSLSPQRLPVLIRSSNQRPAEAGENGSAWGVSDPGVYHLAGMGEDAPLVPSGGTIGYDSNMKGRLMVLGVAAGILAFVLVQKKRGKL